MNARQTGLQQFQSETADASHASCGCAVRKGEFVRTLLNAGTCPIPMRT